VTRPRGLFGITVVAVLVAVPLMVAGLRISSRVIVTEDDIVTEDLYAVGDHVIVEGVVEGDLFVITGNLLITGRVEGDVLGMVGGPARIAGEVGGSVRLAAVHLEITGEVGDDVATVAGEGTIDGSVGRDVLAIAGSLGVDAAVGRDVRAQVFRMSIDGPIGRDIHARTGSLSLEDEAVIGGDVLYKASDDARVDPASTVNGRFTRRDVITPVWASSVTRLFAILSVLGFVVSGLIGMWLFRGWSQRAIEAAERRPGRSALIGLGILLLPPVLMLPLFLTLVGIPVALLLLLVWVVALFLGPLPAVTAAGKRLLRGKGGMAAGLLIGTLVWRGAMWLLPLIAVLLYLGVLVVGLGAYGSAAWSLRREHAA
jgi:cytoskeletal protein CcmA (bactofilin family)